MGLSDLFNKKKQKDDDPIFGILDRLDGEAEYETILQKIDEVPADKRSNELCFRRISALNSLSRFKEAKKEISLLSKRCSEPKDIARLYFLLGYIFDHTNSELKAVECYNRTRESCPDFEGIQDAIDSSLKQADQNLTDARDALGKILNDVAIAIDNASEPNKIDDGDAFPYISMIGASFIPYAIDIRIPIDKLFFKCDLTDKPKMKMFLAEEYGITDLHTLQQWFGINRISPDFNAFMTPQDGTDPSEKMNIKATKMVIHHFGDLLPKKGIAAWDYCTVLALARMAFSCDILSNTEFLQTALFFTDECKNDFSSWEEFSRSVVIGGFYNSMCIDTQYDIKTATVFGSTAAKMCLQNYPKVTWIN